MKSNAIIKYPLIGIVGVIMILLVYVGIASVGTNSELSYFVFASMFVVIVLMIEMYFGKKTDDKLDKIKEIVERIEARLDEPVKK